MTATIRCERCHGTGRVPDWRIMGAKVRAARKRKRLGQHEVARLVGCSHTYLSKLERGRIAWHGPKARSVLAVLGVRVDVS